MQGQQFAEGCDIVEKQKNGLKRSHVAVNDASDLRDTAGHEGAWSRRSGGSGNATAAATASGNGSNLRHIENEEKGV